MRPLANTLQSVELYGRQSQVLDELYAKIASADALRAFADRIENKAVLEV